LNGLSKLQHTWERLAKADPLGAICVDPTKLGGKWTVDEFFSAGVHEMDAVMRYLQSLGLQPDPTAPGLDFGCGVGRLTRAMCAHVGRSYGIDIAPTMIDLARRLNDREPRCVFLTNNSDQLKLFGDGFFGFVYSSLVLQHVRPRYAARYLREFLRVLRPNGILVFQVVDDHYRDLKSRLTAMTGRVRHKLRIRSRLRNLLNPQATLENSVAHMIFQRVPMHPIREDRVRRIISEGGGQIVDVILTNSIELGSNGRLQYFRSSTNDRVAKQYCVTKSRVRRPTPPPVVVTGQR
jgi:ubiquinone/menaquinone biosynthesis C-methylase UbiE